MATRGDAARSDSALVLIHFQRCIAEPGVCFDYSAPDAQRIAAAVERAGALETAARQTNAPIVHVAYRRDLGEPFRSRTPLSRFLQSVGAFEADTPGFEFIDSLVPAEGDVVIEGYGISGFVDTDLHHQLQQAAVDRLVLAGITTSWAVESTARHASDLGYELMIAAGACVDESPEAHNQALTRLATIAHVEYDNTTVSEQRAT